MTIDFELLAWIRRAYLFPSDLEKTFVELGAGKVTAYMLSHSEAIKRADLVAFYQDWVLGDKEHQALFDKFIAKCSEEYAQLRAA